MYQLRDLQKYQQTGSNFELHGKRVRVQLVPSVSAHVGRWPALMHVLIPKSEEAVNGR